MGKITKKSFFRGIIVKKRWWNIQVCRNPGYWRTQAIKSLGQRRDCSQGGGSAVPMLCRQTDTGKESITKRMDYFPLTFGSFEAGRGRELDFCARGGKGRSRGRDHPPLEIFTQRGFEQSLIIHFLSLKSFIYYLKII